jgi:predicted nucleotidyltransferase
VEWRDAVKLAELTALLRAHEAELAAHGVRELAVFGSVARDQARPDSDVDLLVQFDRPVGMFAFLDLKGYLEDLLGRPVDLVTNAALKPQLRERILAEAVGVVERVAAPRGGYPRGNRTY